MQEQDAALPDTDAERLVAGRYRLLSVLGAGGMGRVWRARDEVLQREVAVKEVRAPVGLDAERVQRMYVRLEREAWAAARISAGGVVTVHDVVTFDGRPWIVMELVRGRSLADVIGSRGALPAGETARIGAEVLDALRAAHAAGVLHRDVKPANVLLADDGRVVLTDFGIATVEGDSALTLTGEVVGSPEYLAPERALGRDPGPASDLWSLGVLLHSAVLGRSPFRRTSALSTLRAVVDDPLPPLDRAGPLVPVIEGLLRKDVADRMSAEEAGRQLRLVAAGKDAPADGERPAVTAPPPETVPDTTVSSPVPDKRVDPRSMVAAGVPAVAERPDAPGTSAATAPVTDAPSASETGTATVTADGLTAAVRPEAPPTVADGPTAAARSQAPTTVTDAPTVAAHPDAPTAAVGTGAPDTAPDTPAEAAADVPPSSATTVRDGAGPPAVAAEAPSASAPAPVAPPAWPATEPVPARATGPVRTRGARRTGYLVAAGALVLALLAGGVYALVDRTGEKRTGSGSQTGQASPTASGAAGDGRDDAAQPVSVTVAGGATAYTGSCPPEDAEAPRFTATFTVSELPVQFSYRWVSSNGSVIDREWRTLAFREGGPRTHQETVRLSAYAQAGTLRSEMAVEIRSPFDAVSNSVPFSVTCGTSAGS